MNEFAPRTLLAIVALLLGTSANAAQVNSPQGTITAAFALTEFGNGDIAFSVSASTPGCEGGFWLRPTDPGFKTTYAMLLMAMATQSTVTVAAYNDSIWAGSAASYCRVAYLNLVS